MRAVCLFCVCLAMAATACEDNPGGAVEIAWVIRGSDFRAYACDSDVLGDTPIRTVRLSIRPSKRPNVDYCADGTVRHCEFPCDSSRAGDTLRGVTSFTIPEGSCQVGVTLLDPAGNPIPPSRVQTPDPIEKNIEKGNLTFLGVWQFVIRIPE